MFRNVPNLRIGDQVCAYNRCYTVFRLVQVSFNTNPNDYQAPLILQTSLPNGLALLVMCH